MEDQINRNNVLFIGNGLDRLAGYNTDYPSFLKYYMNNYFLALLKVYKSEIKKSPYLIGTGNRGRNETLKITDNDIRKIIQYQFKYIIKEQLPGKIQNSYYKKHGETKKKTLIDDLEKDLSLKNMGYTTIPKEVYTKYIKVDTIKSSQNVNTWLLYFQHLLLSGEEKSENWTDLEDIIFKNSKLGVIDDSESGLHSYEKVLKDLKISPTDKLKDFNNMKLQLTKYLEKEKNRVFEDKLHSISGAIYKYGTILNFNYGTTYCIPKALEINEFWIHGNLNDGENIVFGYDDGMMVEKSVENRHDSAKHNLYQYKNELHKQFSKTSQLLNLTTHYQDAKIKNNVRLPFKSEVEYVGILGHGIGAADYNYFETLCDFDKVKLEVFWYKFTYKKEDGTVAANDNKAELQQNVMNMLQEMEKRLDRVITHRMLIEQRIIFTELNYQKTLTD